MYRTNFAPRRRIDFRRAGSARSKTCRGLLLWSRDSEVRRGGATRSASTPIAPIQSVDHRHGLCPPLCEVDVLRRAMRSFRIWQCQPLRHLKLSWSRRRLFWGGDHVSRSGEQEIVEGEAGVRAGGRGPRPSFTLRLSSFNIPVLDNLPLATHTHGRRVELQFCAEATYLVPASEGGVSVC
ncbi:hypothetical protein EV421DRAFT_755193 [Armillaria borealis]|uniref:Uncharacterized protein n=1 Tax=Armillaria borealis TaxID=47425 RepID=A0AA39IEI8_9AGAR|nr:hypothetical protein EV421DRAFT_755193 [Armillaria borealis]